MSYIIASLTFLFIACQSPISTKKPTVFSYKKYDESQQLDSSLQHVNSRLQFKLIQSQILNREVMNKAINDQIGSFDLQDYERLKPIILEKDILSLQESIRTNKLTYEDLTKWYLYRIGRIENGDHKYCPQIIDNGQCCEENF